MDQLSICNEILELCQRLMDKVDNLSQEVREVKPPETTGNMVLDYTDVCQVLHISVRYLRILHNQQKLVGFKIGRRRFYLQSDVLRYLREVKEKQNQ